MNLFAIDKEYDIQISIQLPRFHYLIQLKIDFRCGSLVCLPWISVKGAKIEAVVVIDVLRDSKTHKASGNDILLRIVVDLNVDSVVLNSQVCAWDIKCGSATEIATEDH